MGIDGKLVKILKEMGLIKSKIEGLHPEIHGTNKIKNLEKKVDLILDHLGLEYGHSLKKKKNKK